MDEIEEFINYLNEIQQTYQEDISEYYRLLNARESSGTNSYGVGSPGMEIALLKNTAIINLKSLISKFDSLDEVEKIVRGAKEEDDKNKIIAYALGFIEDFRSLDNEIGLGM